MSYLLVKYNREKYWLIHQYDSGYCEIKKEKTLLAKIELVHKSEVQKIIEENETGKT